MSYKTNEETEVKENEKDEVITMIYSGPWSVKIDYFKESGKFYSEGEYTSKKLHLFEIWTELIDMFTNGKRPGLIDGSLEFYAVVSVPDHPHNHPFLITPQRVFDNSPQRKAEITKLYRERSFK